MSGLQSTLRGAASLPRSLYVAAAGVLGLVVLTLSLTPLAEPFLARMLLFYLGALGAYALMPFARRGDIPLLAAWVVLLSELAPCIGGQLISPEKVTADALGVLLAAAPVYVARFRQVRQGDTRPAGRRATDHA